MVTAAMKLKDACSLVLKTCQGLARSPDGASALAVRNDRHAGPPHHLVRGPVACIYQEETGSGRDGHFTPKEGILTLEELPLSSAPALSL